MRPGVYELEKFWELAPTEERKALFPNFTSPEHVRQEVGQADHPLAVLVGHFYPRGAEGDPFSPKFVNIEFFPDGKRNPHWPEQGLFRPNPNEETAYRCVRGFHETVGHPVHEVVNGEPSLEQEELVLARRFTMTEWNEG